MSRITTNDQVLIDRLILDDTDAFEELYRHYWHGLYLYCLKKLQSPEDAKKIVRSIFINLWEQRHALPLSFSLSTYLYEEVRKMVIQSLSQKIALTDDRATIENRFSTEFSVQSLQAARKPIAGRYAILNSRSELIRQQSGTLHDHHSFASLRWVVQSFTHKLSFINILSYPKN